jgi:hypothetical protein
MMTLEYFFLPRAKTPLLIALANERGCTADDLLQEQLDRLNEDSAFSEWIEAKAQEMRLTQSAPGMDGVASKGNQFQADARSFRPT